MKKLLMCIGMCPPPPPPPRLSCSRLSQASVSYYASPITRSIIHDIQNTKGLYLYILCKIPINVREGAFHGPETFIRWKIWDMAVVTLLTRLNAYWRSKLNCGELQIALHMPSVNGKWSRKLESRTGIKLWNTEQHIQGFPTFILTISPSLQGLWKLWDS